MTWALGIVVLAILVMWLLAPAERVVLTPQFDEARIGADVDAYFHGVEAQVPGIREGAAKQVVWAGTPGERTDLVLLYIHGFSASLFEIRPVPDQVAKALGANLVYTRLRGHGRDGAAMTEASASGWMEDMAEALAVARRLGDRVVIVSTSTGGTLTTLALTQGMSKAVAGAVFVSPNFKVKNPAAFLLTWPGVRWWGRYVGGAEIRSEPRNEFHAAQTTLVYPFEALLPMAAAVKAAGGVAFEKIGTPALFMFSDADKVVDASVTRKVLARWGGAVEVWQPALSESDDSFAHVIAGDMLSPGQTRAAADRIVDWVRGLE